MSKKGGAAGPVISKGTAAPPRYGADAPPLPPFPITWTSMAIGVETVEEGLNPAKLIQLVNASTLPGLSITLVDAQEMAEEEMFIDDSPLGNDLKAAKKDFTDKKKDPTKENWVTPEFLLKLISVRSTLDQAFEHREEEVRRATSLTNAKKATEDAKAAVGVAKGQLAAAKEAVKQLILAERKRVQAEKDAKEAAANAPPPPPPDPKAKPKPGGKEPPPPPPPPDFKTELPRLKQVVADAEKALEEAGQKVISSQEAEASIGSSQLAPYDTGRIYWCLGLGPGSEYIANLGAGEENTFGAIFNVSPKYVPPPDQDPATVVEIPPVPVPPLISEMRAVREAAGLAGPARQVGIIDVIYEKTFGAAPPPDTGKKPPAKGAAPDDSAVPYDNIAKAVASSGKMFLLQIRDYQGIRRNSVTVPVPVAVPAEEVDMSYYKRLMGLVPSGMINVPVLLYCMVEQIACKESEQYQLEVASSRAVAHAMKKSFLKTGHQVIGTGLSDIAGCCKIGTTEGKERLIAVQEQDRVSGLAATATKEMLESTTKWTLPSSFDAVQVEKKMLQLLPTPGLKRRGMPRRPALTRERKGAYGTALNTISRGFFSKLERARKLGIFATLVPEVDPGETTPDIQQPISERYYLEKLSDTVFAQLFSNARLVLPFENSRYDADDDCVLVALYLRDGEHMWKHQVHCQVPFGDFCNAGWASELSRARHLSYEVERGKALALEKAWFFFTKGDGIVRCGLPSATTLRRASQTTVYKEGNMLLLREMSPGSSERCFIACLKDGYVVYVYPGETGDLKLQITSPENRTFEVSATGEVLLFPPKDVPAEAPPAETSGGGENDEDANELLSCTSSVVGIMKKEHGHFERWRCVLASGTIVRYLNNGDIQLCFANGNVSKWHLEADGDSSWETTNNKGETIAHFDRKAPPPPPPPPPEPPKKDPKKKDEPPPPPPVVEPPKPSVVVMPAKKTAEMSDPDTGVSISTREDLVVIVNSEQDHTRLVQHADGSQIFSTVEMVEEVVNKPPDSEATEQANTTEGVAPETPGAVEPEVRQVLKATAWCAKKNGFPIVHGAGGNGVKVEFKTSWGVYKAGWSRNKQQLSVELPSGSVLFSEGNTVSFKPWDISEPGTKGTQEQSDAVESMSSIKEWESRNFHLGDEVSPGSTGGASINTGGLYVFDLSEGCVRHTDRGGNGFIARKGTSADLLINGLVKEDNEDASSTKSNPSTNTPDINVADLEETPSPPTEGTPVAAEVPQEGAVSVPLEKNVQASATRRIKKIHRPYAGPADRLFAFYEGGHGFEILDENDVEKYRKVKMQSNCQYASSNISGDEEQTLFHIFVTLSDKEALNHGNPSCRPLQKFANADHGGVFDLSQRDFSLPRAISPPRTGSKLECRVTILKFRQILEYPEYRPKARQKQQENLNLYADLKNIMLEIPSYVPKLLDSNTEEALEKQDAVSNRIKEGLAAQRLQHARDAAAWERRLVENIITSLAAVKEQHFLAAVEDERNRRRERDVDLRREKQSRNKIVCYHKPTDLFQRSGPLRPSPNALLLYFKSEEGLRALFWKLLKHEDEGDQDYLEDARIQVKIHEATAKLNVELVPSFQPVTVRISDVPGARRTKLELRAHEKPEAPCYRPVKVKLWEGRGKKAARVELHIDEDAVKAHTERYLRVQLHEIDGNKVQVDLVAEDKVLNDLPLPGAYHQRKLGPSPVKAKVHDTGDGVKVDLSSENILLDDLVRKKTTQSDPKTIQQRPVNVMMRTYGSSVEVTLNPEDVLMNDIKTVPWGPFPPVRVYIAEGPSGEEVKVEMHPVDLASLKEEEKRTYRPIHYGREGWVPREHTRLSYPKRQSVIWAEEEMVTSLRMSSTKAVWYPNEHLIERRESSMRTVSTSLIKQLRPTVDRPQFTISPDVVNFKKMRFGAIATKVVTLCNCRPEFCRFKVACQDECVRAVYEHGPLAAGMSRRLKITFKACKSGEFCGKPVQVLVETEFDIFVLPVLANVMLL